MHLHLQWQGKLTGVVLVLLQALGLWQLQPLQQPHLHCWSRTCWQPAWVGAVHTQPARWPRALAALVAGVQW